MHAHSSIELQWRVTESAFAQRGPLRTNMLVLNLFLLQLCRCGCRRLAKADLKHTQNLLCNKIMRPVTYLDDMQRQKLLVLIVLPPQALVLALDC
jgi:hypothetical protein